MLYGKGSVCVAAVIITSIFLSFCNTSSDADSKNLLSLQKGSRIVLLGGNLGSRMLHYDHFETEMQLRFPDSLLFFRNMCDPGTSPGFRPNAGRESSFAFPGAEKFLGELANNSETHGHFETEDEWLTRLKADVIVTFFGYSESFAGQAGLQNYKNELDAFIKHTLRQRYNGVAQPKLAVVSPISFEDLSQKYDLPDGKAINENLALYTAAMKEVAENNNVSFVDAFHPSEQWYKESEEDLTVGGFQLTDAGYARLSKLLSDQLFGKVAAKAEEHRALVREAVQEKNWMWHNDYKIPNGVHVYGQRHEPYGPDNYPAELVKIRQMTAIRDTAIWKATKGEKMNLAAADANTLKLPEVKTNYEPSIKNGTLEYLYGDDAVRKLKVPAGYKIELFASEKEFPDLAKPCQLSFDNKGRLWVAVLPTYPHWKPGDPKPNDKLIILEDTDSDGKADKQTIFADGLHLPVGFELAAEGVYVSQEEDLVLLKDNNGDDHADEKVIVLSGFDDHDTHHTISAFCADPSGALVMGEGLFLHSAVETPYGTVRGTWGGFFRFNPRRLHLERYANISIPNPWGTAFDKWGQDFFLETSSPELRWMMPSSMKPVYGVFSPKSFDLIEEKHRVRPTAGLEFVSSRHFPDDVQNDVVLNNSIGFLGTKQHTMNDDGTGYKSRHRQDLVVSEDRNFRPVDLEFAPDGSLYIIDWHNVLIGHMQHNARDPLRDKQHGRVYRMTYPSRPLVTPAKVAGTSIGELLNNLTLPEYRTRYRTRRELRGRDAKDVLAALETWRTNLNKSDPAYEHHLLEALWVSWGADRVDESLLRALLQSKDYHVRSAAVRAVRYNGHRLKDQADLLMKAASDEHGRVRLEAITAASRLDTATAKRILNEAAKSTLDSWMKESHQAAVAHVNGTIVPEVKEELAPTTLKGKELELFSKGKVIYVRDGFCGTCHQPNGKGLPNAGFPPLASTKWVTGSDDRLIKIVLNGLYGPIEVQGRKYNGQVPMTPFGRMLKDEEIAAVLTYVRNSFGNKAPAISPEEVKRVRAATTGKTGFYTPEELLKDHPLEK
jgi:mono/diheme cytochrome c family protein/glucose/arabinose dehydrogenase